MSDISVFMDKSIKPTADDLPQVLDKTYSLWKLIHDIVLEKYPDGFCEWNFPGKKYGWSYRIKDKRRAIIYFLPREGYFKVAFVFGQKAYDVIMESEIADEIKNELSLARKYAEGRGIGIEMKDDTKDGDIKKLIDIKLAN